jgi:dihydrofolate reductase
MARIVYSMMVSLDGYIAGPGGDIGLPVPEGELHRHFNDMMEQTSMELCGRRMYEAMRFWDSPERETSASEVERDFARAWRKTPKIVFSTTLREVGSNARLMNGDVENTAGALKLEKDAISAWPEPILRRISHGQISSTSTGSTCTRWCWVAAHLTSSPAFR